MLLVEEEEEEEGSDLEVLHAEFVFAVTRVRLKLASTIPPPRKHNKHDCVRTCSTCICTCMYIV